MAYGAYKKFKRSFKRKPSYSMKKKSIGSARRGYVRPVAELKAVDSESSAGGAGVGLGTFTATLIGSSGVRLINGMELLSGIDKRSGRKIKNVSVQLRSNVVTLDSTLASINTNYRVALVWDRNPTPAALSYPDVQQVWQGGSTADIARGGFPNLNFKDRFIVLKDLCVLSSIRSANADVYHKSWTWNVNLNNADTIFADANATYASINSGALLLYFFADSATAATNLGIRWDARVRFIDA